MRALGVADMRVLDVADVRALDMAVVRALDVADVRVLDVADMRALDVADVRALDVADMTVPDIADVRALDELQFQFSDLSAGLYNLSLKVNSVYTVLLINRCHLKVPDKTISVMQYIVKTFSYDAVAISGGPPA